MSTTPIPPLDAIGATSWALPADLTAVPDPLLRLAWVGSITLFEEATSAQRAAEAALRDATLARAKARTRMQAVNAEIERRRAVPS